MPEEWSVTEWPEDEDEPTKYWFSILDASSFFETLVDIMVESLRERGARSMPNSVALPVSAAVSSGKIALRSLAPRRHPRNSDGKNRLLLKLRTLAASQVCDREHAIECKSWNCL